MHYFGKIRSLFKNTLHYLDIQINDLSLEATLLRCKDKDIPIGTVIDIGASNGNWSLVCHKYFPKAFYFLMEARQEHEKALSKLRSKIDHIDYVICAASDIIGELYFDATDLFGGMASHRLLENHCIVVPTTTVDYQVTERQLNPPYLLKLDTHGFEVPILEGARQTLQQTNLVVVETYNFKLTQDSLRFHEMCYYMEEHGFRCIDICEPLHRTGDKAFWQIDLFFIRSDHKIFDTNSY